MKPFQFIIFIGNVCSANLLIDESIYNLRKRLAKSTCNSKIIKAANKINGNECWLLFECRVIVNYQWVKKEN